MEQNNGHSPRVSVIIPSFNRAGMLKEAIDSVLEQEYTDFEIIVIDDGSTDDTPSVLNAYGHRIASYRQPNKGVSAARNKGLEMASGALIAFLDSDDLWCPGKLSAQVDFFNAHPEAMICQTEETWIRNNVRVNPKKRHKKPSGTIYERSLALCLVSPSAVMIREELFDIVGHFDEDLPACEDYDLWLRISWRFPVFLIDSPLIIKRGGHDDQLSSASGLDKFRIHSIRKMLDANVLSKSQARASVQVLKEKCRIYAAGCRKRGRIEEARHYLSLASRYLDSW